MGPHLQALICFLEDPNLILYFTVKIIFFVIFYIGWINGWIEEKNEKWYNICVQFDESTK